MDTNEVKKEKVSPFEDEKYHMTSSSVRPGNCLLKIDSFSLLLQALTKTNRDKYDSNHFEAGGYKWKLSLYPNGDKKRDADGYISLYLVILEPDSLPLGWEINVIFKFSVFDHVRDNYLTIQDGKERRFHALKTEWGFSKLLPLGKFNDPSNGYLIDDCCVFGVEIFFHKNEWSMSSVTLIEAPAIGSTCTWKIGTISTLTQSSYPSHGFYVGGRTWMLRLYPNGTSWNKGKHLSLFLELDDCSDLPCGWNIYAEYTLSMEDQVNGKHHECTYSDWFSDDETMCGSCEFMPLCNLYDAARGFLVRDTVIVEGKITVMAVVNS